MSNHDLILTRAKDLIVEKDEEIASLKAELHEAREVVAYFCLWHDPAYRTGPGESLEDLLARARAFLDKAGK